MAKKSSLLIDTDDLLIVLTPLAVLIGLEEATALQQLHYWIEVNRKAKKDETHFDDGHWWVFNTWSEWREYNFPFWSLSTIRRVFESLRSKGLIAQRPHQDNHKGSWFTIRYDVLDQLQQAQKPRRKRESKRVATGKKGRGSGQTEQGGGGQTEQGGVVKLNRVSAQIEQALSNTETTETTPKTNYPADAGRADFLTHRSDNTSDRRSARKRDARSVTPRCQLPERDAMYEIVERVVFDIESDDNAPYDWRGRIGGIARWLKGEIARYGQHDLGYINRPASVEHVRLFADWYSKQNPRASLPAAVDKFVLHWRRWASAVNGKGASVSHDPYAYLVMVEYDPTSAPPIQPAPPPAPRRYEDLEAWE